MMTKIQFLLLATLMMAPAASRADDAPASTPAATTSTQQEKWATDVKTKYNLTDEQMKQMSDAGLHGPELARTAAIAQKSGQPLDKIIQMRTTDKMGWGQIAKKLGLPPSIVGQSVAGMHRNEHAAKNLEVKEERKKEREERKKEHQEEHHENHGKGNPHHT